jgi:hypothetical protein
VLDRGRMTLRGPGTPDRDASPGSWGNVQGRPVVVLAAAG